MKHARWTAHALLMVAFAGIAIDAAAAPVAAQTQNLPSYATSDESIRGRVASFDGKYGLTVRDDRGFIDNVTLREGTVINPTGLRLAPGQSVTIHGRTNGTTFEAVEIDTPYALYGVPAYGYGPYPYGGPFFGYPYAYPAWGVGWGFRGFAVRGWF